jgi:hypothetical protein
MYNSFIFFCKETDKSIKFILRKDEFNEIKNNFNWIENVEKIIIPKEDYLTDIQLLKFKSLFKSISDDFKIEHYFISFNQGIYFTTPKKIFHDKFYPFEKNSSCLDIYQQIIPLNGRPSFTLGNQYVLEWFYEYGIFLKRDIKHENKQWFIHPITNFYLFSEITQLDEFKLKLKSDMEKALLKSEDSDLFIRVINVYDSKTKKLKYRIVNEEFYTSGLDSIIKPFPGDEVYFFRSYKVTTQVASYIDEMFVNNLIDFDFNKNEYYLEVLSAENFLCSYKELSEGLKISN